MRGELPVWPIHEWGTMGWKLKLSPHAVVFVVARLFADEQYKKEVDARRNTKRLTGYAADIHLSPVLVIDNHGKLLVTSGKWLFPT